MIHCDFEDTKLYKEAVTKANSAGIPISLATLRVIKPGEDGFLTQAIKYQPDALLIRSISALRYAKQHAPSLKLIGDWSLNCVNEISTRMMLDEGLERVAPGNDLNWEQLKQLVMRSEPRALEIGAHLHMPMFHMEHCVFAAFLSEGKDHRDCGRPCETHKVSLKDRSTGAEFPVGVDSGCRNTVYNSMPQSAAEYLKRLIEMHVTSFRIEFLRESNLEVQKILDGYGSVLSGKNDGKNLWQNLKASNQVGLTRGTFNLL
jgi:putative protease